MKKLACLLVIFSLGTFAVGCGGKDEKKEDKKESEKKDEAGKNVKIEGGQEVDPNNIQLGGDKTNPITDGDKQDPIDGGDKKDPVNGGDKKDPVDDGGKTELNIPQPVINAPEIDPPKININNKEGGDATEKKDEGEATDKKESDER